MDGGGNPITLEGGTFLKGYPAERIIGEGCKWDETGQRGRERRDMKMRDRRRGDWMGRRGKEHTLTVERKKIFGTKIPSK